MADVRPEARARAGGRSATRRKRVLVLSLTMLQMDARVLRQLEFLSADYDIVVAAYGSPPPLDRVDFVELPPHPLTGLRRRVESATRAGLRQVHSYRAAYWLDARMRRWRRELTRALPVDAIVVNDLFTLPLARAIDPTVPLIFDAREHWTSESESWTRAQKLSMRNAHEWVVDHCVPQTAAVMTVSPGIARELEVRTGVRAALVTNAPYFQDLTPSEVTEPIRLLHMGVADERRRLENTIEAVRGLEGRFRLDLVLARENEYRRRLEKLAARERHINVLQPVPQSEIVSFANGYDVGVHFMPTRYLNQIHALPNKLFDYIQARLAVAIGPSPAMAEVVEEWNCGVVSPSFEPEMLAESLRQLTVEDVTQLKKNADRAARVLSADNNRDTVVELVGAAIAGRTR